MTLLQDWGSCPNTCRFPIYFCFFFDHLSFHGKARNKQLSIRRH